MTARLPTLAAALLVSGVLAAPGSAGPDPEPKPKGKPNRLASSVRLDASISPSIPSATARLHEILQDAPSSPA